MPEKGITASVRHAVATKTWLQLLLAGLALAAVATAVAIGSAFAGGGKDETMSPGTWLPGEDSLIEVQNRKCYMPSTHLIPVTQLSFNLQPDRPTVTSILTVTPNPEWPTWLLQNGTAQQSCSNNPWNFVTGSGAESDGSTSSKANMTALADQPPPLVLNGVRLGLLDIQLDGQPIPSGSYILSQTNLVLLQPPNRTFQLRIANTIPVNDTAGMEGLAMSQSGSFITQCEPSGFRRITYYMDRPDVLSRFTVTIEAPAASFPVLLSNGKLKESGSLGAGQHFAVFEDPIPKPAYLFALVAGPLAVTEGTYSSPINGNTTKLRVYIPPEYMGQTQLAMRSLQQSMQWDEAMFARQYNGDVYNMVGTEEFGPQGMENTGLNVFQLSLLAAHPDTHTDSEAQVIRDLVAHEYFHHWSGNRVTLRDWFELSLKEGLTELRQQLFAADIEAAEATAGAQHSGSIQSHILQLLQSTTPDSAVAAQTASSWRRVLHAQVLTEKKALYKTVRPESIESTDELYSTTIYDKGAEVIRMYHTILGPQGFAKGLNQFFDGNDGKAVTFEDLHAGLAAANPGIDISGMLLWLPNKSPPVVSVSSTYDADTGVLTLAVDMENWEGSTNPPLVPVKVGILDANGVDIPFQVSSNGSSNSQLMLPGTTATINTAQYNTNQSGTSKPSHSVVLLASKGSQGFKFQLGGSAVEFGAVSWLRDWSAPVFLNGDKFAWIDSAPFLAQHDVNPYARWDAVQRLAMQLLLNLYNAANTAGAAEADATLAAFAVAPKATAAPSDIAADTAALLVALKSGLGAALSDDSFDGQLKALLLELPPLNQLYPLIPNTKPLLIYKVRSWLRQQLASQLQSQLEAVITHSDAQLAALYASPLPAVQQLKAAAGLAATISALKNSTAGSEVSAAPVVSSQMITAPQSATGAATGTTQTGQRRLMVHQLTSRKLLQTVAAATAASVSTADAAAADAFVSPAVSARAARNAALGMLVSVGNSTSQQDAAARYYNATCLTDRLAALKALEGSPAQVTALSHFYSNYGQYPQALLKWFKVQASSEQPGNTFNVLKLMSHPSFQISRMDHCNALLISFTESSVNFHAEDGSGYRLVANAVLKADEPNTNCARRLVNALNSYQSLAQINVQLICKQLSTLSTTALSEEASNVVQKGLNGCE